MTDTTAIRCPHCGTSRAAGAAWRDLCPACLLATALALDDETCPYQVLAPIAESPGAVIYLAKELTGARGYAALKIYGPRDDIDAILSRYDRWAPTLAGFQHRGFGRLLNVNLTSRGQLFVVSEYIPGRSLTAVDGHAPVDMGTRIELAHQLIAAIEAAHAVELTHLTLAPSKVKFSTAQKAHATILGLGSSLIVDGAEAQREPDLVALARLVRFLGVQLPERQYATAAAIRDQIPAC